jgi:ABC-type thiamin/hydroxymethylpyrimidine transport system permease subunit
MRNHMFGFTLQESLFLGFCSLLILSTKLLLRLHLKVPGHSMFFLILFLMLAALCVRKRWSATLAAVMAGLLGMFTGSGKLGPLAIVSYMLPALVVDFCVPFLQRHRRNLAAFALAGMLAAAARAPVSLFSEWMGGMDLQVLVMSTAIKGGGGMVFGALGGLPVPALLTKLEARGLLPAPATTQRS